MYCGHRSRRHTVDPCDIRRCNTGGWTRHKADISGHIHNGHGSGEQIGIGQKPIDCLSIFELSGETNCVQTATAEYVVIQRNVPILQVIQLNKLPLIVTFIGNANCNTGHILALDSQIDGYLDEIKQTVTEA